MKIKEKGFLLIMVMLFLLTLGMFYYQNFYKSNEIENNKMDVLIATKDINDGLSLTEKNVGWKKIDKDLITPNYITKENNGNIGDMKVSSKILEGEIININRLLAEKETKDKINKYSIDIVPNHSSNIEPGDLIRVYVQIVDEEKIYNRLVFEKKEVLEVIRQEDGLNTSKFNDIKVEVSDKESISYYNAKQRGNIIVLKYENNTNLSDHKIPFIDIKE